MCHKNKISLHFKKSLQEKRKDINSISTTPTIHTPSSTILTYQYYTSTCTTTNKSLQSYLKKRMEQSLEAFQALDPKVRQLHTHQI